MRQTGRTKFSTQVPRKRQLCHPYPQGGSSSAAGLHSARSHSHCGPERNKKLNCPLYHSYIAPNWIIFGQKAQKEFKSPDFVKDATKRVLRDTLTTGCSEFSDLAYLILSFKIDIFKVCNSDRTASCLECTSNSSVMLGSDNPTDCQKQPHHVLKLL